MSLSYRNQSIDMDLHHERVNEAIDQVKESCVKMYL